MKEISNELLKITVNVMSLMMEFPSCKISSGLVWMSCQVSVLQIRNSSLQASELICFDIFYKADFSRLLVLVRVHIAAMLGIWCIGRSRVLGIPEEV